MKLIVIDGVLYNETYYYKNKNKETCGYCKHCDKKNYKESRWYVGRCSITNLKKCKDQWCNKFIKIP